MSSSVKTVQCGIGGYGEWYLSSLFRRENAPVTFAGFVDPAPERSAHFQAIREAGIPIYASLEEFYARDRAELVIIASPIQFHCPQTVCALEHGSHVLCEKPVGATVQEARLMLETQRRTGLVVAIGYQESFLPSTQALKADVAAGVWGKPVLFKGVAHWGRSREYYQRNSWAGRIRDARGRWVLDSPVNNATSHYLHHLFYLLGDAPERSARPLWVEAGLYRVHDIENYDTAFLRAGVAGGATVFYAVTHAGHVSRGPVFEFVLEQGTIRQQWPNGEIIGVRNDGRQVNYGVRSQADTGKILDTVAAIREGRPSLCGIEAAMSQTLCMNGAQEAGFPIADIPRGQAHEIVDRQQHWLDVDGLDDILDEAFRSATLPRPPNVVWSRPGSVVELTDYTAFPKTRNEETQSHG